jgi:hypothetical protein
MLSGYVRSIEAQQVEVRISVRNNSVSHTGSMKKIHLRSSQLWVPKLGISE